MFVGAISFMVRPLPIQDAVAAAGPLLTLLGFIILPLIWSVPEALVTAELATAFPENRRVVCVPACVCARVECVECGMQSSQRLL